MLYWDINVHDKYEDIRLFSKILRAEFGREVFISVSCNGDADQLDKTNIDDLLVIPNRGGIMGTRDQYKRLAERLKEKGLSEEWVVSTHAKGWLTRPSVVLDFIRDRNVGHDIIMPDFINSAERDVKWERLGLMIMRARVFIDLFLDCDLGNENLWTEVWVGNRIAEKRYDVTRYKNTQENIHRSEGQTLCYNVHFLDYDLDVVLTDFLDRKKVAFNLFDEKKLDEKVAKKLASYVKLEDIHTCNFTHAFCNTCYRYIAIAPGVEIVKKIEGLSEFLFVDRDPKLVVHLDNNFRPCISTELNRYETFDNKEAMKKCGINEWSF